MGSIGLLANKLDKTLERLVNFLRAFEVLSQQLNFQELHYLFIWRSFPRKNVFFPITHKTRNMSLFCTNLETIFLTKFVSQKN